jgi:hypothetical protein
MSLQKIDGGYVAMPDLAFYNLDGAWHIENRGVAQDEQSGAKVGRLAPNAPDSPQENANWPLETQTLSPCDFDAMTQSVP